MYKFPCVLTLAVALVAGACIDPVADPLHDPVLDPGRIALLELAFEAAASFPTDPHEKNRSRAQGEVVDAALALGQVTHARGYAERITNWQSGLAAADCALQLVRRGAQAADVAPLLERAAAIADDPAATREQDWRRGRIRVRIAETWLVLGDRERAAEFLTGASPAEAGHMDRVAAELAEESSFEAQLAAVDSVIAAGDFDTVRHALDACVTLYDRFYDDVERRDSAEKKVEESWHGMPVDVNLGLRAGLSEAALRNGDAARALAVVDRAWELFESTTWRIEDRIRLGSRLAGLRHRSGQDGRALLDGRELEARYAAARDEIVDIYRADCLVPLAEMRFAFGDVEAALAHYGDALTEALHNPNSRPRCDDLVTICCSLAVNGVAPGAELERRLREAAAVLWEPW